MSDSKIFFTTRDQVFTITVYGLKPLTTHYCYFERNLVAANSIKPKNGKLGNPIVTDSDGSATFDFYYSSGVTEVGTDISSAQKIAAAIAGVKELVVVDYSQSTLSADFLTSSQSVFVGNITISVYIVPESQYQEFVNYVTVFPSYMDGPM